MTRRYARIAPRRWLAWAAALAVLAVRALQAVSFAGGGAEGVPPETRFAAYNSAALFALLFAPLYCLWLAPAFGPFQNTVWILRHKSRREWLKSLCGAVVRGAAGYALLLNLPAYLLASFAGGAGVCSPLAALGITLLHAVFFANCGLVYFLAYLPTRRSFAGFLAMLLYPLWDYMGLTFHLYAWPYVGLAWAIFDPVKTPPASLALSAVVLLGGFALLLVVVLLAAYRVDFMDARRWADE